MQRLTIVVPTFNRAATLTRALRALVTAVTHASVPARIVVVDNNSSDGTRSVVERFAPAVDYVFEPQQGLSFARNAGIAAHRASDRSGDGIIAFTDDDVEVAQDWVTVLWREFSNHPDVDCIGGRVAPVWQGARPEWVTEAHWGPLALQDHGPEPRTFDERTPLCLIGANVAFRASLFDRIGLFDPHVQRVRDGIGSTEDHEVLLRVYAAGGRARYVPDLVVNAEVPRDRLTRDYHRRWHKGHGRFHALMRTPGMEASRRGRLLGVPAHVYRSALKEAVAWFTLRLSGRAAEAFVRETRLWFFSGYIMERAWLTRR